MALCIADCLFPRRLLTGLPRDRGFVLLEFLAMQLCPFPNNSWHCIRRLSVKQVSEMTRKELSQCGKMIEVIPIGFFHQSIVCLSIHLPMSVYAVYNSPRLSQRRESLEQAGGPAGLTSDFHLKWQDVNKHRSAAELCCLH